MTEQQARQLVAVLRAAFPSPAMSKATAALYAAELARLPDAEAAAETLQALVRGTRWLPTIAEFLETYRAKARRNAEQRARERGIEEPPPDPDRAKRAREYLERLRRRDYAA